MIFYRVTLNFNRSTGRWKLPSNVFYYSLKIPPNPSFFSLIYMFTYFNQSFSTSVRPWNKCMFCILELLIIDQYHMTYFPFWKFNSQHCITLYMLKTIWNGSEPLCSQHFSRQNETNASTLCLTHSWMQLSEMLYCISSNPLREHFHCTVFGSILSQTSPVTGMKSGQ